MFVDRVQREGPRSWSVLLMERALPTRCWAVAQFRCRGMDPECPDEISMEGGMEMHEWIRGRLVRG